MHVALANVIGWIATVLAGWLMVRAGTAKHLLNIRPRERCPACGRRVDRGRCPCVRF
jgi:hypothetical protein